MSYVIISNYKNKYIERVQKKFAKKYKTPFINNNVEIPEKYKDVIDKDGLRKVLSIQKNIYNYSKILYLDNCFITPDCKNILDEVPVNKIGLCHINNNTIKKYDYIEKIVDSKNIYDTHCMVIPNILYKYLTDENIEKYIFLFNNKHGDILFLNQIIKNYNIDIYNLGNTYNGSFQNTISNKNEEIKNSMTLDVKSSYNDNSIINLTYFSNYVYEIITNKLYNYFYKKEKKDKKFIGLSINNRIKDFYSNGINLNIHFWYDFIKLCGYEPVLITYSENTDYIEENICIYDKKYNIIDARDIYNYTIINSLYLYFNVGLSLKFLEKYLKNKTKLIYIILGSVYYNDVLNFLGKEIVRTSGINTIFDEIWISPHFEYSLDYIKYRYSTDKVYICPYFWEPYLFANNFEIKPFNPKNINIGIVESNINFYKHCIQPIMICNKAYSENKECINNVMVFNTITLKNNNFFIGFNKLGDLFKDSKISFEGRLKINEVYNKYSNCIISYSENCDLNYVTFECLYLGIPIIHNSYMLKDYGYYYEKLNTDMGKDKLLEIFQSFNKEEYITKNKPILQKYSIYNKEYQNWFINKIK